MLLSPDPKIAPPRTEYSDLLRFIRNHWDDTVRHVTEDSGQIIGLPHPYTVPCRKDTFQELYYWDTFYTNEGLLAQGCVELARANVDNMLHLIERFGFMPNGNRTYYLSRSQPPHLALMVERVFAHTGDTAWLARAVTGLEKEQTFWATRRLAACGLNHYGHQAPDAELIECWSRPDTRGVRTHIPADDAGKIRVAGHGYAECESGWDFCPRFERRCQDYCPVDLNALLFASESILSRAHRTLGNTNQAAVWHERAEHRSALMRRHLWSEKLGAFTDYDHVNNHHSPVLSAAVFYPVWLGVANPAETARTLDLLPRLERPHGILTCEPGPRSVALQWDAPNAWPPLQYATVQALLAGDRTADARRVADAFLGTVTATFERTGDLWEKYNAETGDLRVHNEYELPAMMGWTAGVSVYLACTLRLLGHSS